MKKTLLLISLCLLSLAGLAQTKTYNDYLVIRVDEEVTDPIPATVLVDDNGDGTINFNLKNFVLFLAGDRGPIGNISVMNLPVTEAGSYKTFVFKDDIVIAEGDAEVLLPGESWIGPMLESIPLNLQGKMTDDRLYVNIDITFMGQIINVKFAKDDFSSAIRAVAVQGKHETGTAFDLTGRRVTEPAKGLYIVNGRKVFAK